jgi:hypothetical protein
VGLRLLACGLESRRGLGCLFLVGVVCCQVESAASDCQSSPTECAVFEGDLEISTMRRPKPTRAAES